MKKIKVSRRRCAGCGRSFDPDSLIRIKMRGDLPVIGADGGTPGRSAYVCNSECLKAAIKKRGFERAFRASVPKSFYDAIREELLSNEP